MLTNSEKISLLYGLYSELRDMDRWKDIVKPEKKEKIFEWLEELNKDCESPDAIKNTLLLEKYYDEIKDKYEKRVDENFLEDPLNLSNTNFKIPLSVLSKDTGLPIDTIKAVISQVGNYLLMEIDDKLYMG